MVEGIAAHDDGWTPFDAQPKVVNGRPLSFLEFLPRDFIVAWNGSIENAEKVAPIAGAIVSRHFWRLGRARADGKVDGPEGHRLLVQFLEAEERRQGRLLGSRPRQEFEFLTDVLQFCDVLSLYLCCGAEQDVEFPQKFGPKLIQLRREAARHPDQAAVCRFDPSPFREGGLDVAVAARRFPPDCRPSTTTLPFLLW